MINKFPRYPNITVKLIGFDGNAFAVIGAVIKALKKANVDKNEIDIYWNMATAGDYNNLLRTTMEWVNVE